MLRNWIKKKIKIEKPELSGFPQDVKQEVIDLINKVTPFTMTSTERLLTLFNSIEYLHNNKIQGDFIECGVWKGGSIMAMILKLQKLCVDNRNIWLYDTFEGMTAPKQEDKKFDGTSASKLLNEDKERKSNVWAVSHLEEVVKNISTLSYPENRIKFIKGPVEETLNMEVPDKISLLRLDTDWYESTKIELEILFPKLVKGGVLIIDDYGHWKGCKLAVDEYFAKIGNPVFLHRIDYTGRILIKSWDD
ncbi:Macrocin-O-methyltransferase (TylF) [Algoriphagus faecimaris]|uniref:Macrocin-O-methyltransferase (TylF) n=1 Tax=Algoriphagus faecimaris TaxID=686796 RepID=A0A1G6PRY5_9BACT|nr:TylF/MycF/NovP-related O-methyltransferase [Algoriphagus faecimaris]SDC82980.1 Macrocin-O-methyltransferase (TylF) [Algoriphagus faecimaris]